LHVIELAGREGIKRNAAITRDARHRMVEGGLEMDRKTERPAAMLTRADADHLSVEPATVREKIKSLVRSPVGPAQNGVTSFM
jgi:hypothetical protein